MLSAKLLDLLTVAVMLLLSYDSLAQAQALGSAAFELPMHAKGLMICRTTLGS